MFYLWLTRIPTARCNPLPHSPRQFRGRIKHDKIVLAICQSKLAQQQKQIEALSAGLQKVSAQLEVGEAAPQRVLDRQ